MAQVRYPPASAYRNPYVQRTRAPSPLKGGGKVPDILRVARTGKYKNMRCVADAVGVSRERVRQVLNEHEEFDDFGLRNGFRLEWDCPDCGVLISLKRHELRVIIRMPAHCRRCSINYCYSERHNMEITGRDKGGGCYVCVREKRQEVVEVRTCQYCGKNLNITHNAKGTYKTQSGRGKYHQACYLEIMRGKR